MKKLYLRDEDYNWIRFEYEELSDLSDEFKKNKITIGNSATIGNFATIGDEIILITGLFINGTKNTVTYVGSASMSIGCYTKKISWFKKNYKILGVNEGYTSDEIEEYYTYILLAEIFHKNLIKHEKN